MEHSFMVYIFIIIIINNNNKKKSIWKILENLVKEICPSCTGSHFLVWFFTLAFKLLTAQFLHFYDLDVVILKIVGSIVF